MNEFFPQILFYRTKTKGVDIDDESDGETNYYIKNSLYSRNAYQQTDPMKYFESLQTGINLMKLIGTTSVKFQKRRMKKQLMARKRENREANLH